METKEIPAMLLKAHEHGHNAAMNADIQIIAVVGYEDDPFPICGFGSIRVKGIRGKTLTEFKKRGFDKSYTGGQVLSVRDYNQSYDMKKAYAQAFAKVLKENGFNAWAESRLD